METLLIRNSRSTEKGFGEKKTDRVRLCNIHNSSQEREVVNEGNSRRLWQK